MKHIDVTRYTAEVIRSMREGSEPSDKYEGDICMVMEDLSLLYRKAKDRRDGMFLIYAEPLNKIKIRRMLNQQVLIVYDDLQRRAIIEMVGCHYRARLDRHAYISFQYDSVLNVSMEKMLIELK